MLLCIEYTDDQTQTHYSHKVIPFYGVTATETECSGTSAKPPKKGKGTKKPKGTKKTKGAKKPQGTKKAKASKKA
ncbi:MAG: hypothetical protein KY475_10855 [Planctomycetes bacterium]|nr:hypothetical protein [Planctomycetota bacterium]